MSKIQLNARLAARAMVRDYEGGSYHEDRAQHDSLRRGMKQQIVSLGCTYSLVTEFTSFVAIESRQDERDGKEGNSKEKQEDARRGCERAYWLE